MSATVTNLQEFSLSLKKFQAKSEKQAIAAQGKVTLEILRGVIKATPVDTGVLRGNWVVAVGAPEGISPIGGFTDTASGYGVVGSANIANGAIKLSSLKLGQASWVVNHTEYAGHVEATHPSKSGFTKAVVENVRSRNEASGLS